jgi:hypothetical protein
MARAFIMLKPEELDLRMVSDKTRNGAYNYYYEGELVAYISYNMLPMYILFSGTYRKVDGKLLVKIPKIM